MARRKKGAAKEPQTESTVEEDLVAETGAPDERRPDGDWASDEQGAAPQAPLSEWDTARTEVIVEREALPAAGFIDEDTAPTTPAGWQAARAEALAAAGGGADGDGIAQDGAAAVEGVEVTAEGAGGDTTAVEAIDPGRIDSIIESLLFASDRPLGLNDLKRLLGERDGKKITAAVESLTARRADTGVHVVAAAGGWQLRTSVENAHWVGRLLSGRPARLSRAMLETLSIVAYRQPVTRPEIDDIRGVDCGPVLKTLLDRGLIRIIGKREEVGRPLLYGTTPDFLRTFNLRDLAELPTLREFHELGTAEQAEVDAHHGAPRGGIAEMEGQEPAPLPPDGERSFMPHPPLAPDPDENDGLLEELDRAAQAAALATGAAAADTPSEKQEKQEKDDRTAKSDPAASGGNAAPSEPEPSTSTS